MNISRGRSYRKWTQLLMFIYVDFGPDQQQKQSRNEKNCLLSPGGLEGDVQGEVPDEPRQPVVTLPCHLESQENRFVPLILTQRLFVK
jgi:hypothetical protein